MRIILQRVKNASVSVDGQTIGEINKGYLVLLGVSNTDTKEIAEKLSEKISKL
ncbi:MAG: D-aminoacyl-tRNA deacylase, partial [Clostridia bacterium]|nr:D-aminoacyl-tRNA deacylase [Clostridia bacterium]